MPRLEWPYVLSVTNLVAIERSIMNLNTIKRGFSKTNPEKGLRSLPGAHKEDHRDNQQNTIRISGKYIPNKENVDAGKALGMLGYVVAWVSGVTLVMNTVMLTTNSGGNTGYAATALALGGALVHGCSIFADTMRNTEAPWARKGIVVFWSGVLLSLVLGLIL